MLKKNLSYLRYAGNQFYVLNSDMNLSNELEKHNSVIVILSSEYVFSRNIYMPKKSKNKIDKIIKYQILNNLPYEEDELYYCYILREFADIMAAYVYAVKKEIITTIHNQFDEKNILAVIPENLIVLSEIQKNVINANELNHAEYCGTNYYYYNKTGKEFFRIFNYKPDEKNIQEIKEYIKTEYGISELIEKEYEYEFNENLIKPLIQKIVYTNLIDSDEKTKKIKTVKSMKKTAALVFVNISIFIVFIFLNYQYSISELKKYQQKINSTEKRLEKIRQLKSEFEKITLENERTSELYFEKIYYSEMLNELSRCLPVNVKIDRVSFNEDKIDAITCIANSALEVLKSFEKSKRFVNMRISGSVTKEEGKERFTLQGEWK